MGNFYTSPSWQEPGFVALPLALQVPAPRLQWRVASTVGTYTVPAANGARTALYDFTTLPWDSQVGGQTIVGPVPAGDPGPAQQLVANLQAQAATAQTALEAARASLATATAALAAARTDTQAAQDALDAVAILIDDAQTDSDIATRRHDPAGVAAAQARIADLLSQSIPLSQTLSDAAEAQGEAEGLVIGWQTSVRTTAQNLALIQDVSLPAAELDLSLLDVSALAAGSLRALYFRSVVATVASGGDNDGSYDTDAHGCVLSVFFNVSMSAGEYRIAAAIPDDVYRAVQGLDCAVNVVWTEVTSVRGHVARHVPGYNGPLNPDGTVSYTCPGYDFWDPAPDPTVTFVPKTAALSLADAVYDEGANAWTVYTPAATLTPPDPGSPGSGQPPDTTTITVQGAPLLPTTTAEVQRLGAERFRQGFYEYTTAETATQARRYLTLTASSGPGTPTGISYGGTIRYEVPPASVLDGTYPQTPTDYWDATDIGQPLVRHHTLNSAVAATYNGSAADLFTAGNQVLTPTVRTLARPPGLVLTLSEEQTPGDIQSAVESAVGADWPALNPLTGEYPAIPAINTPGAIHCVPDAGDYCGQQKMRFKLTHGSSDSRVDHTNTFTTTHHWEYHTRNLLTGAVTVEPRQATLTWPYALATANPDGTTTTQYVYSKTDADWTEIPVPGANASVTLVLLPGENDNPTTFGGVVATLVAQPAGG